MSRTKALLATQPKSRSVALDDGAAVKVDFDNLRSHLPLASELGNDLDHWRHGMNSRGECPMTLERIEQNKSVWLEEMAAIKGQLRAATQTATKAEIAKAITILAGCFPNSDNKDLTVYGHMAVLDVAARTPTRIQVDSAFAHLRRTKKFLPTISELLEAVDQAPSYRAYHHVIGQIEHIVNNAEKIDADNKARRALADAEREKRTAANHKSAVHTCAWRITHGYDPLYSKDIVAEAQQLIESGEPIEPPSWVWSKR